MTDTPNLHHLATQVIDAAKEDVKGIYKGELDRDQLYFHLLQMDPDLLAEVVPALRDLEDQDYAGVMGVVIERLQVDNIVTHGQPAMWIQVTPSQEGMHPSSSEGDRRWIRLATIEEVHPQPIIAIGNDSRHWQRAVQILANEKRYHVTPTLFKGLAVKHVVDKVLALVNHAVSEENRRRMQL
ncbi:MULTISPECIES: hypothetical protein [Pseudomonas]|uniref:hypothetical protein n=1 Tax=Pseudomonas TaxID=286 RepID=UPI001BAEBE6B|nr:MULTISPECIES: hypothetical protein [Pseudomonas]QUG93461.1 hypothetical protein GR140_32425 [Pseudomonas putida]URD45748.1 hypothetical protein M6G63_28290 [Pseudomonas sp. BYT-5]URL00994.1 hypothetical protein J5X93_27980 [Pseudomonas sp. BYT-1]WRW06918.1 hypothetical protein VPZ82_30460 [Pseudomonas putida]